MTTENNTETARPAGPSTPGNYLATSGDSCWPLTLARGDPPRMPRPRKYPDELMQRGVRLVFESGRPIARVAADLGVHPEALRKRVRQAEADSGQRGELLSTAEREEIKKLRKENFELRRANEILKSASVFFGAPG